MRKFSFLFIVFFAIVAFRLSWIAGGTAAASRASLQEIPIYKPLPHHVPPVEGGISFRFAMVHDVIHERYARHSDAYYIERERLARETLAVVHPQSVTAFAAIDDIAVGLDRRGLSDQALEMMRDKLNRQKAIPLPDKELYSTYANQAEFLLHQNLWPALGGDQSALDRLSEARDLMTLSMKVNPNAHFERETLQLEALEMLIAGAKNREIFTKADLFGNRLENASFKLVEYTENPHYRTTARPYTNYWPYVKNRVSDPGEENRRIVRGTIQAIGGGSDPDEKFWGKAKPFDEPALWLVGEWRQGSGPSPHYALALGEIMLRVGQRFLAWNCYERAALLADRFHPDPRLREFFKNHCLESQAAIEHSLLPSEVANLRPQFQKELARGESYQHAYQEFEENKIRAGGKISDPEFYAEFHAQHGPIASRVGAEEWYAIRGPIVDQNPQHTAFNSWASFSGGAGVLLYALVLTCFKSLNPWKRVASLANSPPPAQ